MFHVLESSHNKLTSSYVIACVISAFPIDRLVEHTYLVELFEFGFDKHVRNRRTNKSQQTYKENHNYVVPLKYKAIMYSTDEGL